MKNLKVYILLWTLFGSIIIFSIVSLFTFFLYNDVIYDNAKSTSKMISQQVFSSMYQIMKKGWTREELEEFVTATKSEYQKFHFDLDIYRGKVVEDHFGVIKQKEKNENIIKTFNSKIESSSIEDKIIRYTYPIKANNECLKCHVNAKETDVLGVIEVKQDLKPLLDNTQQNFLIFLLIFLPIPILGIIFLSNSLVKKLIFTFEQFRLKVEKVTSVKDIKNITVTDNQFQFKEINTLFHGVELLIDKLKNIAVDKDILEFQIKLMDKFVITSDVVKDWKEYVKDLLMQINAVIEACSIFTIFQIDEGELELDIFWTKSPTATQKNDIENLIKEKIKENTNLKNYSFLKVKHEICNSSESMSCNENKYLSEFQTKSLMLSAPKIGGVVGIGVQSEISNDNTRFIVIESILTTLLNVVGSVKAIYKYTKDLEYYATRDPLTNLYNQRVFWDFLNYEISRAKRHDYQFGLMIIDMDNFKMVNDRFGHSFGDAFLKEFSRVVRGSTREEDIVARYGGDEFTVILPESSQDNSYAIGTRIRDDLEKLSLRAPDGNDVSCTVSIGITTYPNHSDTAKDLFLIADNMMYRAKKEGKNTLVVPNEEDIAEVFKEKSKKSQLVMQILNEDLLVPYFQPIVDVGTGEAKIHEVLMRVEKDGKIISAEEFIDVAENMGVVHRLDYLLLNKAFAKVEKVNYKGILFLNFSPRAFIIPEFISNVKELAEKHKIPSSQLVFEITERETVRNMSQLVEFIKELKKEGFKFAIDDFGSGFSSFNYIKQLPIDYIKVDGEFIRNMVVDKIDLALVKSVTTLAQELEVKTVAEYVEDEEILKSVRSVDINYAQGFYVGYPKPELSL